MVEDYLSEFSLILHHQSSLRCGRFVSLKKTRTKYKERSPVKERYDTEFLDVQ